MLAAVMKLSDFSGGPAVPTCPRRSEDAPGDAATVRGVPAAEGVSVRSVRGVSTGRGGVTSAGSDGCEGLFEISRSDADGRRCTERKAGTDMRVEPGRRGELAVQCAAPADEFMELDTAGTAGVEGSGVCHTRMSSRRCNAAALCQSR